MKTCLSDALDLVSLGDIDGSDVKTWSKFNDLETLVASRGRLKGPALLVDGDAETNSLG